MFVSDALGELAGLSTGDIEDVDVRAPVVIEVAIAFPEIRLIQIARDHDRISRRFLVFRTLFRRDERYLLAIRRPRNGPSRTWVRTVGPLHFGEELAAARIRMRAAASSSPKCKGPTVLTQVRDGPLRGRRMASR